MSLEDPKLVSRNHIGSFCFDPEVRRRFFVPCPLRLFQTLHDTIDCAQNIYRAQDWPSAADVYTREWILSDVLRFRADEGTEDVRQTYYVNQVM
jgi:hypothetical protein